MDEWQGQYDGQKYWNQQSIDYADDFSLMNGSESDNDGDCTDLSWEECNEAGSGSTKLCSYLFVTEIFLDINTF